MTLVFTLKQEPDQRLDLSPLVPHRLEGKSTAEIAAIELQTTRETRTVGDVFDVKAGGVEAIRFEGGSARFDNIGADLKSGEITLEGEAGHARGPRHERRAPHHQRQCRPLRRDGDVGRAA